MTDDVETLVFELLSKRAKVVHPSISRSVSLAELGIDSLGGLELIFALEDHFKISIPDDTTQEVKTAGDIIDAIHRLAPRPN
jgi:acyl carrier protein